MTDRLGELYAIQVETLSAQLEAAHGVTLRPNDDLASPTTAGCYLLELEEAGVALLLPPTRTVAEAWRAVPPLQAEAAAGPDTERCPCCHEVAPGWRRDKPLD